MTKKYLKNLITLFRKEYMKVHKQKKIYAGISMLKLYDIYSTKVLCDDKIIGNRKTHYWWSKVTCEKCLKLRKEKV